jgi:PhoPQ-activated pathogenicity-related protein
MTSSPRRSGALVALAVLALAPAARAAGPLDAYVARPDDSFAWKELGRQSSLLGKTVDLELTSQTWQGFAWTHRLRIYQPGKDLHPDAMLLFVAGGGVGGAPGTGDDLLGTGLARACGARVGMLFAVPNQPLLGGKTEDDLIVATLLRYRETGDASWPLLFPMVKSAVRAMDALEAWSAKEGAPARRFALAGGSKRGWVAWLTPAVDPRVIATAPIVIEMVNIQSQRDGWREAWGRPSLAIEGFTRAGLVDALDTPEGRALWALIDPWDYRDRLALPKLIVNATNDPYWTVDALNRYWDGLSGPKHVVYLPNSGHGCDAHRDYAVNGAGALFRRAVAGKTLPKLDWRHGETADGALELVVTADEPPAEARVWVAAAPGRDFRGARWNAQPMEALPDGRLRAVVPRPAEGRVALFADLAFRIDDLTSHLSTAIRQAEGR